MTRWWTATVATAFMTTLLNAPVAYADPAPSAEPAPGVAPSPERFKEAKTRYERGAELFDEGDYKLALIEFERSYALVPAYQTLYNIGQVNYQLNNYAGALTALKKYLDQGGSQIAPERRKDVERDIRQLTARTAHVTVLADATGADVVIDDLSVGKTPLRELLIEAGQHKIVVSQAGRTDVTRVITLAAGDSSTVQIELPLSRGQVAAPAPQKASYTWVGWTATGLFAAGAVATGVAAVIEYRNYRDQFNSVASASDFSGTQKAEAISDARSATITYTAVTIGLGAAALVSAGITTYFALKGNRETANVRVGISPSGTHLYGTF